MYFVKACIIFLGPFVEWILVFRDDTTGGPFSPWHSYEEVGSFNVGKPNSYKYSIMAHIKEYKLQHGKGFRFKLCYPEINPPEGFEESCNEWYQTSDPYYDSAITGYEPISIPFKVVHPSVGLFGGLGKKKRLQQSYSAIDADPKGISLDGTQFVIGLLKQIDHDTAIPGPYTMGNGFFENSVEQVELYVKSPHGSAS